MNYRYAHFKRQLLMEDMKFQAGPNPEQPMPDFNLPTTDGGFVRKADYVDRKPLFLTLGSVT
jgi:hypothetical protein